MNALKPSELVSVAEYLTSEQDSLQKHEYVGGLVCAMSAARTRHNRIATSPLGSLHQRLLG